MGRLESLEVLKRLFWMARCGSINLNDVELVVVDRSATGGVKLIELDDNAMLLKDRVITSGAQIPAHRIIEIRLGGETLWRKEFNARTKS